MNLGNVIIFGDSYSTYKGHIPEGYAIYYSGERENPPDLSDVKKTWWKMVLGATESNLILNNSWSGSTIGYTGYDNQDCSNSSSFIFRLETLIDQGFFVENKIDTVFVFGGTNDSWANAPLGELKYNCLDKKDLYFVLPAISYFACKLNEIPNKPRIIFIGNTEIKREITNALQDVCIYYGYECILLSDVDKENGHPTEIGMRQISDQVLYHMSLKFTL